MPRYYCDYCDTYLTHDSPSVRKQHNAGYKHKANVRTYYQQFEEQQTQSLIDQRIKEHLGQAAAFQVGATFHQHLAALPQQRPGLPILPTPMLPVPGMRPPILPQPLPGAPGYGAMPPPMMPQVGMPPGVPPQLSRPPLNLPTTSGPPSSAPPMYQVGPSMPQNLTGPTSAPPVSQDGFPYSQPSESNP